MGNVYLVEATSEHVCQWKQCPKPGKKIAVGDKAIKTKVAHSTCSSTEYGTGYFHEDCWNATRKGGRK